MPYIIIRGNLKPHPFASAWECLVSGLKACDVEQLSQFHSDQKKYEMAILYTHHPCVILTALEVLGYKVITSSVSCCPDETYHEYIWTMWKDFAEPEPETEHKVNVFCK